MQRCLRSMSRGEKWQDEIWTGTMGERTAHAQAVACREAAGREVEEMVARKTGEVSLTPQSLLRKRVKMRRRRRMTRERRRDRTCAGNLVIMGEWELIHKKGSSHCRRRRGGRPVGQRKW